MDKDSNIRTYPDMGELAFGKTGRLIISGLIYTELFLVSVGFLILEGDNLSNLFPTVEIHTAGLAIGGKKLFVILVALVLDNLRILSYVSASRVFASAIIILSISWTATFDGVGFHQKGTLVNWKGNPTAVLLVSFLLSTAGYASMAIICCLMFGPKVESQFALMVTPITNALKDLLPRTYRNRATRILISTVLVIRTTTVALVVPFFGYLMSLS
ncbi:hypothetical protein JHK85_026812 [Glycine max]|nr:hypothetical protein JHK85_026812 [Glycine max]